MSRFTPVIYASALLSGGLIINSAMSAAPTFVAAKEEKSLRSFLDAQCYSCHDSETQKGGLALDKLPLKLDDEQNFEQWVEIFDRVKSGEMPPPNKPRPEARELAVHLDILRKALRAENVRRQAATGRVVLRRLNRVEYENTLHGLLGIDTPLKQLLPEDTPSHGFDTVADGLRLSQLHMEKYLEAADVALDAAIRLTPAPDAINKRFLYKEQDGLRKNLDGDKPMYLELDNAIVMFHDASYITRVGGLNIRHSGNYRLRASGWSHQSKKPVTLRLYAGSYKNGTRRLLGFWDMPVGGEKPEAREVEVVARLEEGEFLYPSPDGLESPDGKNLYNTPVKDYKGSGLALQWIEVEGPQLESWPPPSVKKLFGDTPLTEIETKKRRNINGKPKAYDIAPANAKDVVRPLIEDFAVRAFRRPLEAGEADGFVKLAQAALDAGRSFEDAMRVAFRAILIAPELLLFDEKSGKLNDYALASRLAYFLWSAPPDQELLKLAANNQLGKPDVLRQQTERLLSSPKAKQFTRNFVGQWLDLRSIDATSPDMRLYPEFDELLKFSMVAETENFFDEILKSDLPINNFISSDWIVLNRRLADHYGMLNGENENLNEAFQRVALPADSPRGGVLTQASVLKVTANGTVTSPVLRGAWVLKRIMGTPPSPPPADVGSIEPDTRGATTVREQLDKHRTSQTCNSCHQKIDPPGFALENFDVIGGWRDNYRSQDKGERPKFKLRGQYVQFKIGPTVDASGSIHDGRKFVDIREFKKLLLDQNEQTARALTGKLLTYGTGAGVQFADRWAVEDILKNAKAKNLGLRSLVHEVVQSPAFRTK